jgi:PleD family two-component response regulator
MTPQARILVVDDHPTNRLKLEMSVKRLGYASGAAENGLQALEYLRNEPCDLVLLDIIMPEMDGYELLATMQVTPELRDIPVVVVSTLENIDSVVRAIELGAADHLPKTFNPILLKARIGACIEKKRMRDAELEYLRQVSLLSHAASHIEAGNFNMADLHLDSIMTRDDELGRLASVFVGMADEVNKREQLLRQQIQNLRIEINRSDQRAQVSSITGTDYFKSLRDKAGDLRTLLDSKSD